MKKITIITGHYGTGKTNLSVNLALNEAKKGTPVTVVDLDLVNPYFRTADFKDLFASHGVTLIAPEYANSNVDLPTVSFDIEELAQQEGCLLIDVGGDDAGTTALGRYAEAIMAHGDKVDMLYVLNCYRYLTRTPDEALTLMQEIETASRLRHTGLVNNSNLGCETTAELITGSLPFAQKIAKQAGLPLLFTTADKQLNLSGDGILPIDVFVKPLWEQTV